MKTLLCCLLLSSNVAIASAAPKRIIQNCTLEDGSEAVLQAQHDTERDGDRFYLTIDGTTQTAFTDLPDEDYVGQISLSKCLKHVLIFAMTYGAPYNKGVVIRKTSGNNVVQRINFSEKALPALLYLGQLETELIIPNAGYEVPSKYLLYRFHIKNGQPDQATGIDAPPPRRGFDVVRVDQ